MAPNFLPQFAGSGGTGNEFITALIQSPAFQAELEKKYGTNFAKADTISQSTNLLWYDLSEVVQMLYPYRELTPRISVLPRVPADGGTAHRWKRIVGIDVNDATGGVAEGDRAARIALAEQDMMAAYRAMGAESSTTFEGRLGGRNLRPEVLGMAVQASLRSLRIYEEKALINANGTIALGITPTPTAIAGAVVGVTGTFSGAPVYLACVALTGMGRLRYRTYSSATNLGGVPGQITRINADGSSVTFGGGSAQPSAQASATPTGTQAITATVTPVAGAFAYAWYAGYTSGVLYLAGLTPSNQVILSMIPASTNQPMTNLQVASAYQDNSVDVYTPDGLLPQLTGAVTGPDPGRLMSTNPLFPAVTTAGDTLVASASGALVYTLHSGNTGLTVQGSNFAEIDILLEAAFDQYKIGFDRMLISSADSLDSFGAMLGQSASNSNYRILFDADQETGRIVAGRRVTAYLNKFFNNTLEVEIHPYVPPGTIVFWSDRSPYELSGVANLIEAIVRQDYYQIQWPWRSRRYEYGVYVDEVFPVNFCPGFALITNKNPSTGDFVY